MIVLDIETSGLDKVKSGIWQMGAIDLTNPDNYFLEEAKIDDEDIVTREALKIIGKSESELRDNSKQSQHQMIKNFFDWIEKRPIKNFLCQNPVFDVAIVEIKANKYKLKIPFHYRSFDLHNFAQAKYFEVNSQFLIKEAHSDMGLSNILVFCGMKDNRESHNALEDCKLTAECFSRLVYGKNLFPEYSKFKLPDYLKK